MPESVSHDADLPRPVVRFYDGKAFRLNVVIDSTASRVLFRGDRDGRTAIRDGQLPGSEAGASAGTNTDTRRRDWSVEVPPANRAVGTRGSVRHAGDLTQLAVVWAIR